MSATTAPEFTPAPFFSSIAPALLLVVFVVTGTQVDLFPALMWHDQQRAAQAAFFALLALAWFGARSMDAGATTPLQARLVIGFVSIAILGAISAQLAPVPRWAWLEWATLMGLCIAIVLVSDMRRAGAAIFDRAMCIAVVATATILALRFLGTYLAGALAGSALDTRELAAMGFSNRRFLGQLLTLILPLLASPLMLQPTCNVRRGCFALLAVTWAMAFTSATRGTFLGLAVAMGSLAVVGGLIGRQWVALQIKGVIAGFSLYALMFLVVPWIWDINIFVETRTDNFASSSGRINIWLQTIERVMRDPWLGVGPMHFAYLGSDALGPPGHPHNSILQFAVEWGIPVTIIAIITIARSLAISTSAMRGSEANVWVPALIAAVLASLTQSLVDGVFVMPVTQTFLVVVCGWLTGHCLSRDTGMRRHRWARDGLVGGVFTACLAVSVTIAAKDFPALEERQSSYIEAHRAYLHPRFWQQGLFGELDR